MAAASASTSARQGRTRRLLERSQGSHQDDQQEIQAAADVFEGNAFEEGGGGVGPDFGAGHDVFATGGRGVEVLEDRSGGANDHDLAAHRARRELSLQTSQ